MQLPEHRHQKGSLPAAGRSDDQVDFSLLEDHVVLDLQAEVSTRGTGSGGSYGFRGPGEGRVADTDE